MISEESILWILISIGVLLFAYSLRKPPIKEWLLFFLLTGYLSSIIGVIVVEENLLSYPVNLFNTHFDSSFTYEYILFPVLGIYYYQSTYRSGWLGFIVKAAVFSSIITIMEYFLERYTNLIHYISWTWMYTFISTIFVLVLIRMIVKFLPPVKN
ncbi:CBO0543 family protein [Pseudalkalibacillus sp. NRS-1564]|uniref:CBO0543 family protein n=1 Tax=Pseudalkalibacillus sp. NRS-1564 TaxID=3233900 RepID=UPI003D290078